MNKKEDLRTWEHDSFIPYGYQQWTGLMDKDEVEKPSICKREGCLCDPCKCDPCLCEPCENLPCDSIVCSCESKDILHSNNQDQDRSISFERTPCENDACDCDPCLCDPCLCENMTRSLFLDKDCDKELYKNKDVDYGNSKEEVEEVKDSADVEEVDTKTIPKNQENIKKYKILASIVSLQKEIFDYVKRL